VGEPINEAFGGFAWRFGRLPWAVYQLTKGRNEWARSSVQPKSGRPRKVFVKSEKQLESEEIAVLLSWTEQRDFLNAQPEYVVTTVVDYPDWFVVTRYSEDKRRI
jgi:hypothetical protein